MTKALKIPKLKKLKESDFNGKFVDVIDSLKANYLQKQGVYELVLGHASDGWDRIIGNLAIGGLDSVTSHFTDTERVAIWNKVLDDLGLGDGSTDGIHWHARYHNCWIHGMKRFGRDFLSRQKGY